MAQQVQHGEGSKEKAVLFYDKDCGFCTWSARTLEKMTFGKIRGATLTSEEANQTLATVDPEKRYDRAWLKQDAMILGGYEAMWHSFYLLPLGFILKPLRLFPGFHPLSERVYRFIADRRSPQCRLKQRT